MGKNIGSLGRKREPLDLEFDYFGTTVRMHPYATDAVEVEFIEAAMDVDLDELVNMDLAKFDAMPAEAQVKALHDLTAAQRKGFLAMMRSLRYLIHPDDFDAYWKIGNDNGQQVRDRMLDIKALTEAVIEATTDFPTQPPSLSQAGRGTTAPSSEVVSPSPEVSDFERAMALERGRPDIQEFFVMEQEAKEQAVRDAREAARKDREKLAEAGLD